MPTPLSELARIARALAKELRPLRFGPPVTHVYNPLEYARRSYERYVDIYGKAPRQVVMVGMNPGPWGMAQTGVPFGEVAMVRDWLGIEEPIRRPPVEHPKRPVQGFSCTRSEVSGRRLWGWARESFKTPQRFFQCFFIANYCPLTFIEASGRNRTPDKLPAAEREPLFAACDRALRRTIEYLQPHTIIGIGRFAETRAGIAAAGLGITVRRILHPSPANPLANQNWTHTIARQIARWQIHPWSLQAKA